MLGGERPTRPRPGGNTPPAGGNTQTAAPTPENTPARPPRRATYGKQYWLLDPATGIYSNVPEGTEGAIASGQRPPNETPGSGTERVTPPLGKDIVTPLTHYTDYTSGARIRQYSLLTGKK